MDFFSKAENRFLSSWVPSPHTKTSKQDPGVVYLNDPVSVWCLLMEFAEPVHCATHTNSQLRESCHSF